MTEPEHRRWAGQVIVAGYPAGGPPDAVLDSLAKEELGGVILFRRNLDGGPVEAAKEVKRITDATVGPTPFVAIDQEGGRVQRLGPPVLQLPPMERLGRADDPALTRRAARVLGRQLAALGFDLDFAPVLDVNTNPDNRVIGDRSFGSEPELVARHGLAFAAGLAEAGLVACGKHFPGHGDTVEDSHLELPALPHAMDRLERVELVPFRAAVGTVGSIMTAHIVFRALDPDRPATLSPAVVGGLLRERLRYDGLVVSDDLEMKAIADHFSTGAAAVEAIRAGCDLLLVCETAARVEEARAALAAEADRDPAFAAALKRAAGRCRAVREGLRSEPVTDPEALARIFDDPEARAVSEALQRLR
ncbi:MAG TPA: beta-N-acetylhexosaminidase [Sandaracinaceae bacterium LLY-WYZ-13_1]|nr:beta-N-acetylhexosaminidase [Sandaracinaceae bacterium LLY-WYZ-13_1]